jgi:hypothetical protein
VKGETRNMNQKEEKGRGGVTSAAVGGGGGGRYEWKRGRRNGWGGPFLVWCPVLTNVLTEFPQVDLQWNR